MLQPVLFCTFVFARLGADTFEALSLRGQHAAAGLKRPPFLPEVAPDPDGDGGTPVAPYDDVALGVDALSGDWSGPSYHPPSEDVLGIFPREVHDDSVNATPSSRNTKLTCSSAPRDWQDSRGYDCAKYGATGWCTHLGEVGPGWEQDWPDPEAFSSNGLGPMRVCCECGGGLKYVVAAESTNPLDQGRLVANEDRLPESPDDQSGQGSLTPYELLWKHAVEDATTPKRDLVASADRIGLPEKLPAAPHDAVSIRMARRLEELYSQARQPDPMGLSARFYGAPPQDCFGASAQTSAIVRAIDYSEKLVFGLNRNLQSAADVMTASAGVFWGRWSGTLRVFKPGKYIFDLDIGFSTESRFLIDGLELLSSGQCRVSVETGNCDDRNCLWAFPPGFCDKPPPFAVNSAANSASEATRTVAGHINLISTSSTKSTTTALDGTASTITEVVKTCPHCDDRLCLVPIDIRDCPLDLQLPNCDTAGPGELCEAEKECGTAPKLNNCGRFNIYRKALQPSSVLPASSGAAPAAAVTNSLHPALLAGGASMATALANSSAHFNGTNNKTNHNQSANATNATNSSRHASKEEKELPLAELCDSPGCLILAPGYHCIDIVVMLPMTGRHLQLSYAGPDTAETKEIVPGQVLFCDPVIDACQRPEVEACAAFKPQCDTSEAVPAAEAGSVAHAEGAEWFVVADAPPELGPLALNETWEPLEELHRTAGLNHSAAATPNASAQTGGLKPFAGPGPNASSAAPAPNASSAAPSPNAGLNHSAAATPNASAQTGGLKPSAGPGPNASSAAPAPNASPAAPVPNAGLNHSAAETPNASAQTGGLKPSAGPGPNASSAAPATNASSAAPMPNAGKLR